MKIERLKEILEQHPEAETIAVIDYYNECYFKPQSWIWEPETKIIYLTNEEID